MKKIIEHLKEYWKTYVAYVICTIFMIDNMCEANWIAALYCLIIFFLLSTCFELDKAFKRVFFDLEDLRRYSLKQKKQLKEIHEKYEELGLAYIRLKKKYEPEELAKEIAKELQPKKRRQRRWQKKDTPMSK